MNVIKVLIVKVSSLGDVVHTMPVVADILHYFPNAQIDWVVEEAYVDLVCLVKGVHHVFPFALRRWKKHLFKLQTWKEWAALKQQLKKQQYDYVIDCQGLLKTAWLAKQAHGVIYGLKNRTHGAGYEWPVRLIYNHSIQVDPAIHVVERSRYLVAESMRQTQKLSTTPIQFNLDIQKAQTLAAPLFKHISSPYVVFIHATSRQDKEWPLEEWLNLGDYYLKRGWSIVLPWGSEAERKVSEQLAAHFGKAAYVPPKLNLVEVVAILSLSELNVGVDTGLIHISAALSHPTVQIYQLYTPTYGFWSKRVVSLFAKQQVIHAQQVIEALPSIGL